MCVCICKDGWEEKNRNSYMFIYDKASVLYQCTGFFFFIYILFCSFISFSLLKIINLFRNRHSKIDSMFSTQSFFAAYFEDTEWFWHFQLVDHDKPWAGQLIASTIMLQKQLSNRALCFVSQLMCSSRRMVSNVNNEMKSIN